MSNTNEESNSIATNLTSNGIPATRPSCPYGHKCYRQSVAHREAMAHLGDVDFKVDTQHIPEARPDAPDCPYGLECYRLNPEHFRDYKHPPDIDVGENYKNHHLNRGHSSQQQQRRRRRQPHRIELGDSPGEEDFLDEDDEEEDPFAATDSDDATYMPSDED